MFASKWSICTEFPVLLVEDQQSTFVFQQQYSKYDHLKNSEQTRDTFLGK